MEIQRSNSPEGEWFGHPSGRETSSASRRRRDALIDGRTVRKWPRSGILVRAKKGEPLGAWLITSGSVRLPCGVRAANAAPGIDVYLRRRAMAAQDGSASAIYSTRETGTAPARLGRELNGCESPPGLSRVFFHFVFVSASRVSPSRDTLSSRFRINFERCRSSG